MAEKSLIVELRFEPAERMFHDEPFRWAGVRPVAQHHLAGHCGGVVPPMIPKGRFGRVRRDRLAEAFLLV